MELLVLNSVEQRVKKEQIYWTLLQEQTERISEAWEEETIQSKWKEMSIALETDNKKINK